MRGFIAFPGVLGALVFGGAFVASWVNQVFVESFARDLVRIEVEKRVGEKIDFLEGSRIATLATRISGHNAKEADDIKRALAAKLPQKIVAIGAALIVGYQYLFRQDWLHTIVFGDYVGFAYFAYLGVAIGFLADIVFNRARITTPLANAAIDMVGGAFTVLPC